MQDYREFIDEVYVDATSIEKRVRELGNRGQGDCYCRDDGVQP